MSFDAHIADTSAALDSPNGEAVDEREVRRMDRLFELEQLRRQAGRISARLCDLIEGNLPTYQDDPLARLPDPVLAFTRVATVIRRVVALEEQIDEDAETREFRLADELEKRVAAMEAEEKARNTADFKKKIRVNRHMMRKAVLDGIDARDSDMSRARRELLLNDLLADLDDLDYIQDPDVAIARIREELDAILGPPPEKHYTAIALPQRRKTWEPTSARDEGLLMVQSIDAVRRKLTRMADG